jgi:hypothetical protein
MRVNAVASLIVAANFETLVVYWELKRLEGEA